MDPSEYIRNGMDRVSKYPIYAIFANPIYISLIISFIIILIVIYTFDDNHKTRTWFWSFIVIVVLIFTNNHYLMINYKKMTTTESENNISDIMDHSPPVDDELIGASLITDIDKFE